MKLAIITGSSRGLGFSITQELLSQNWDVVGISRTTPSQLLSHPKYKQIVADLANLDLTMSELTSVMNQFSLHQYSEVCFVHNASMFWPVGMLPNLEAKEIQAGFAINLVSAAILSQFFLKYFEDKKVPLRMIFISSPAATIGIPGATIYCAAKSGLEMLVKGINAEIPFYKNMVKCVSFMPGRIDTEMQTQMRSYSKEQFPVVDRYKDFHAQGLLQKPDAVASIFCKNLLEKEIESGKAYSVTEF